MEFGLYDSRHSFVTGDASRSYNSISTQFVIWRFDPQQNSYFCLDHYNQIYVYNESKQATILLHVTYQCWSVFQNSLTGRLTGKFVIKSLLNIPSRLSLNNATSLWTEPTLRDHAITHIVSLKVNDVISPSPRPSVSTPKSSVHYQSINQFILTFKNFRNRQS